MVGSGTYKIEKKSGSGIQDKHPGAAKLVKNKRFAQIKKYQSCETVPSSGLLL
jgi:hypothetical protein